MVQSMVVSINLQGNWMVILKRKCQNVCQSNSATGHLRKPEKGQKTMIQCWMPVSTIKTNNTKYGGHNPFTRQSKIDRIFEKQC